MAASPAPPVEVPPRRPPPAIIAGVAVLAAAVYLGALRNGFALDDEFIVRENPAVRGFGHLHDLLLGPYWPQSGELYRPLTLATFAADWAFAGGSTAWMHGVNVALHAAAAVLVALLVWRLGGGAWATAAAGAVFAVHPVHVEAVASLVGRAELLATVPVLLACHLHLSERGRPGARIAGVAILYLLALGAKEIAVSLPALLLAVDALRSREARLPVRRLLARNLALLGSLAAALAAYLALRRYVLGSSVGIPPAPFLRGIAPAERLATAARLCPEYLRLLLWPRDLSADWGPDAIVPVGWGSPLAWTGVATLVLLGAAAWASWRRTRWVAAAVLWLAAAVFPVSHVLFPVGVMLGERSLYLASVSLAFLLPALVSEAARQRVGVRRAAAGALAVLLVLGAVRTWRRVPVWKSSSAVFDSMREAHPELWWVDWKAGELLVRAGRPDEALPWYEKALRKTRYNHYPMAMDYASLLLGMGRGAAAEPLLRHAVAEFPASAPAYLYLASLRFDQGRYREAVELSRRAAAVPRHGARLQAQVEHRLALAYDALGQVDSALAHRRAGLALPGQRRLSYAWYHYARLLAEAHDPAGAAAALDSARVRAAPAVRPLLRLDPLPPLSSPRVKGWGRVETPGPAAAAASPRTPAGPPRPR